MPIFHRKKTVKSEKKENFGDRSQSPENFSKKDKRTTAKGQGPGRAQSTASLSELQPTFRSSDGSSVSLGHNTPSPDDNNPVLNQETKVAPKVAPSPSTEKKPSQKKPEVSRQQSNRGRSGSILNSASEDGKDYKLAGVSLQLPEVNSSSVEGTRRTVTIRKQEGGFGFRLRQEPGSPPVHVVEPNRPDSVAASVLLAGDRLVAVNGTEVERCSHAEIVEIITKCGDELQLTVVSVSELAKFEGSTTALSTSAQADEELGKADVERVWLVHKDGFSAATRLPKENATKQRSSLSFVSPWAQPCHIRLDSGDVLTVDENDVERANPKKLDRAEDFALLRHLNESSVLHTLRQRYGSSLIHTFAGLHLLVVNPMKPLNIYSKKVMERFHSSRRNEMPPHVFAVAELAYHRLRLNRTDQSIIPMGISGSGKTVNVAHILRYLSTSISRSKGCPLTGERVDAIQTVMRVFGSASSVIHDSATRYTSLTTFEFDTAGQLVGGNVQTFLVEKSRAVRHQECDLSFHIFYQLYCGADAQLRTDLQLHEIDPSTNVFFLNLPKEDDDEQQQHWAKHWHQTLDALEKLAISAQEMKGMWMLLAAIMHLGQAGATKAAASSSRVVNGRFSNPAAAQRAATILGTSQEELTRMVFYSSNLSGTLRPMPVSSPGESDSSLVASPSNSMTQVPAPTGSILEALESFAIGIYDQLFNALLQLVNRAMYSTQRSIGSVRVLDMPGLQNPVAGAQQEVGLSFEDLCHNYAQERLQMLFHDHVFTLEQERYAQESIVCNFTTIVPSPLPVISVIDRMISQRLAGVGTDRKGILWLLEEEAARSGSTDQSFLDQLQNVHGEADILRDQPLVKVGKSTSSFILIHCQGTMPIQYSVRSWLRRTREHQAHKSAQMLISDIRSGSIGSLLKARPQSVARSSSSQSSSSTSLTSTSSETIKRPARRSVVSGGKRSSVCVQTKFQLDLLMDTLRRTNPHFILCILPAAHALPVGSILAKQQQLPEGEERKPHQTSVHIGPSGGVGMVRGPSFVGQQTVLMDVPLVRLQIRRTELVNAMRIYRQGFPDHLPFGDFIRRFRGLCPDGMADTGSGSVDEKKLVSEMLDHLSVEKTAYRLGLSQVFLRAGSLLRLETLREERSLSTLTLFQAHCRGMLVRRRLEKMKVQSVAVQCLQRNVRKFIIFRNWTWWKLYTKVKPLLDVHRTDEELREKQSLIESLQTRIDKLHRDNLQMRESESLLKERVVQLSGDLQEEQSLLRSAEEQLEGEQMQRLRFEQQLTELQAEHQLVKQQKDQLNLQLVEVQLLNASHPTPGGFGENSNEEEAGENYYRDRYRALQSEHGQTLQRMRQEFEQDTQRLHLAKRQAEKELLAANAEADDFQGQLSNMRKKVTRLESELADLQLHLEEEQERNSELEKKQKRFDLELNAAQEEASRSKDLQEELSRKKEMELVSKRSLEKQLEEEIADRKRVERELRLLKEEMEMASSLGSSEERELSTLRSQKRELERKVEDQEEELEDLAGQLHQHQQARTRLEMANQQLRQQHQREMESKEEELEAQRFSSQRKVKGLQVQYEDIYEEKQEAIRARHEAERHMQDLRDQLQRGNPEAERRLRKQLHRTRTLLKDAQAQIQMQQGNPQRFKAMRNQVDELQEAAIVSKRALTKLEREIEDVQMANDSLERDKKDLETKLSAAASEREELENRLEEEQDEMESFLKKHSRTLEKLTAANIDLEEQRTIASSLSDEKDTLKRQLEDMRRQLADAEDNMPKQVVIARAEAKMREMEEKYQMECAQNHRHESTINRLKENIDRLQSQRVSPAGQATFRSRRDVDLREAVAEAERKEAEASAKCRMAVAARDELESDLQAAQTELDQARKRIRTLQKALDLSDEDFEGSDFSDGSSDEDRRYGLAATTHRVTSSSRNRHYSFDDDDDDNRTRKRYRYDLDDDDDDVRTHSRSSQPSDVKPSWRRHFSSDEEYQPSHRRYDLSDDDSPLPKRHSSRAGNARSSSRHRYLSDDDDDINGDYS